MNISEDTFISWSRGPAKTEADRCDNAETAVHGSTRARYDKEHLVPFMEYFPLGIDFLRRSFGRIREFAPGGPTPPLPGGDFSEPVR